MSLPEPASGSPGSWRARVQRELWRHRTAYIVLVPEIFPEATPVQAAFGGACLGAWAALGSSAGKFFGD